MLIHIGSTPRERPRPLRRRSTLDSRPLTGRSPRGFKTSSWRRTGYLLYRPLLTLDRVSLFVFRGSSTCVIVLVGFSVSLMFPLVNPLVFPLVFFVFLEGSAPFVKDRSYRVPPYIILVSRATLITISEPPCCVASLVLLFLSLIRKFPTKIAPLFL